MTVATLAQFPSAQICLETHALEHINMLRFITLALPRQTQPGGEYTAVHSNWRQIKKDYKILFPKDFKKCTWSIEVFPNYFWHADNIYFTNARWSNKTFSLDTTFTDGLHSCIVVLSKSFIINLYIQATTTLVSTTTVSSFQLRLLAAKLCISPPLRPVCRRW